MKTLRGFTQSELSAAFNNDSPESRLWALWPIGGFATAKETARALGVSHSTGSRMLNNAVERGVAERRTAHIGRSTVYIYKRTK